jgi:hypothetical protein
MLATVQSRTLCPLVCCLKAYKLEYKIYNFACGCETWSLILREEHRPGMFENRVLRRIFEPKRDEVTGGWRKLHNEQLHNLYSPSSIIRIIKSEG